MCFSCDSDSLSYNKLWVTGFLLALSLWHQLIFLFCTKNKCQFGVEAPQRLRPPISSVNIRMTPPPPPHAGAGVNAPTVHFRNACLCVDSRALSTAATLRSVRSGPVRRQLQPLVQCDFLHITHENRNDTRSCAAVGHIRKETWAMGQELQSVLSGPSAKVLDTSGNKDVVCVYIYRYVYCNVRFPMRLKDRDNVSMCVFVQVAAS